MGVSAEYVVNGKKVITWAWLTDEDSRNLETNLIKLHVGKISLDVGHRKKQRSPEFDTRIILFLPK